MTEMPPPAAPAGWYPHPTMVATQAYWDGAAWTEHLAPAGQTPSAAPDAAPTEDCPYCLKAMPEGASRCPHCGGERGFCRSCNMLVATTKKQKNVGPLRGGMKVQTKCTRCTKVIDGPWF